ncbi:uncharacterized protein LOC113287768 [Papaver somniferum]|nr:uncharacterized protein LOC113287768 [Papaver somniferum]
MTFRRRKPFITVIVISNTDCRSKRWFSTGSDGGNNNFAGENAYEILMVSESSSFDEIKASFRKLAKETHPDLVGGSSDPASSQRFVQILAAYEILSDSEKRAHYDMYLFSQRKVIQKVSRQGSPMFIYESDVSMSSELEVVEWLRWYRYAINDIVSQEKIVVGTGYFDVLEGEFYSAVRAAYYGPYIESLDYLPECFEAEERSAYGTPDVLHLVSGRDLFGIVCIVNKRPELARPCYEKLSSFSFDGSNLCQSVKDISVSNYSSQVENQEPLQMETRPCIDRTSDVYKDLELHIGGKVVAMASRIPPKTCTDGIQNEDNEDHIHVFLSSEECPLYVRSDMSMNSSSSNSSASKILLGTITGLGNNCEEGSCYVYNNSGTQTHVIMKHRTLMVKHMHWYQAGKEVSPCECRCSRARLPPSKFWLFEPRCHMHDVGGWYVETFGRDKKGKTVPSQRQWDSLNEFEQPEQRLHPAMYLLTLAYRSLDLEDAKRRKRTVKDIAEAKLLNIFRWCKKLV